MLSRPKLPTRLKCIMIIAEVDKSSRMKNAIGDVRIL